MVRYLFYFSYLGTKFNGMQRQAPRGTYMPRVTAVSDVIENALRRLKPRNNPVVMPSSRTDTGVHALCSACHVDLHHEIPGQFFQPEILTQAMNLYFVAEDHSVRILKTIVVPEIFNCRHQAKKRTYVYRLAVRREPWPESTVKWNVRSEREKMAAMQATVSPLMESNLSSTLSPPFDHRIAAEAVSVFRGLHNFLTFSKAPDKDDLKPQRNPVRFMEVADISPGRGVLSDHDDEFQNSIDYWDVTVASSGFLHRQVRKMVGAVVGAARGRIIVEDIRYMLTHPDPRNYHPKLTQMPAHGLFLKKVHYDENDFVLPPDYFHGRASYTSVELERLFSLLERRMDQLAVRSRE